MQRASQPRTTVGLSKSLQEQLNMYALAATAAGVSALALAQPAEAKIVYTPTDVIISGHPLPIDLNHDGIVDFFLFHYYFHTSTGGNALLACLDPAKGSIFTYCGESSRGSNALNAFRVVESGWGAAVQAGAKIVGGDRFRSMHSANLGSVVFPTSSHFKPAWRGPWMNGGKGVRNRYLGVKFQINKRFHFGWARITVTTQARYAANRIPASFTATLTGYAYETVPDKGIVAGKTRGPDAVVEPATLGHLAAGASAIPAWRVKRTAATTH
ncbi:MAG TPA: hypothetical protein VNZ03_32960 [Terriglobales bacterium]|nr:hypothetical protein [Terriglobales bacterium]